MSYEIVNSNLKYSGKIMDIYSDKLTMPNGYVATREYIDRRENACAVLPINERNEVIFVKQYRHPVRDYVLEIPAGMMEKGEDPVSCAMRELEEEIGFKCNELKLITSMIPSVGICTERIYIYLADKLIPGKQNFDFDEFIELEYIKFETAVNMIYDGRILDSKTMVALLAYKDIKNK